MQESGWGGGGEGVERREGGSVGEDGSRSEEDGGIAIKEGSGAAMTPSRGRAVNPTTVCPTSVDPGRALQEIRVVSRSIVCTMLLLQLLLAVALARTALQQSRPCTPPHSLPPGAEPESQAMARMGWGSTAWQLSFQPPCRPSCHHLQLSPARRPLRTPVSQSTATTRYYKPFSIVHHPPAAHCSRNKRLYRPHHPSSKLSSIRSHDVVRSRKSSPETPP